MGDQDFADRVEELGRPGPTLVHQIERDLDVLARKVPEDKISAAYRNLFRDHHLLRNLRGLAPVLYEVRAASMLASAACEITLNPPVGSGRGDVMCLVGAHRIFVEVTTCFEKWPPPSSIENIDWYERASVERSFNPMPRSDDPKYRDIPASKVLRDRIKAKAHQLPGTGLGLIVLGAPNAEAADIEAALFGDGHYFKPERYPNGLFAVSDATGGASPISALVWLRLEPIWSGVRVQARLFLNPLAVHPVPSQVASVLCKTFDRREVLKEELERITRLLVEQYHAIRIILFGSLATERRKPGDWVHEWSDIDLAVVAQTSARFSDRIGEVSRLVRPRVGLNVLVYTPEEFERAEREGGFFVRDEIVARGHQLYP
jgi:predicted nucleotidyltransferase